jgi:hypothetical protein
MLHLCCLGLVDPRLRVRIFSQLKSCSEPHSIYTLKDFVHHRYMFAKVDSSNQRKEIDPYFMALTLASVLLIRKPSRYFRTVMGEKSIPGIK